MKTTVLLLLGAALGALAQAPAPTNAPAAPVSAQQSPPPSQTNFWSRELRTVKRVVNGRTIDLTPLVRWYQQAPTANRPLRAWVLVTGKFVSQTAYGWQVSGYTDNEQQARPFIIKNPPTESLAEFNRLKARFNVLLQRQTRLNADLQRAQQLYTDTEEDYRRRGYVRFGGDLLDQRQVAVNQLRGELARLGQDIQVFEALGQDLRGEFTVRCFALKTGQAFNGLLLYDHGYVLR